MFQRPLPNTLEVLSVVFCFAGLVATSIRDDKRKEGSKLRRNATRTKVQSLIGSVLLCGFTIPTLAQAPLSETSGNTFVGVAQVTPHLQVANWAGFKSAVSFTFDDSQPSQIAHFGALQAVGVRMTFYISTALNGETNYDSTWSQAVSSGSEIGNHTVHHCHANLTGCSFGNSLGSLAAELDQTTSYITQHYGQKGVWTGASPFGDTGYDSAASSRFFVYRGVGSGTIGPNDGTDPHNLPVHLAATGETASSFNSVIDSAQCFYLA